ncbi:MAG: hypothetical protein ACRDHP_15220 [Ktedonobacterales bacterium]
MRDLLSPQKIRRARDNTDHMEEGGDRFHGSVSSFDLIAATIIAMMVAGK